MVHFAGLSRNGPSGESLEVLRSEEVETTYKREDRVHPAMKPISSEQVWQVLEAKMNSQAEPVPPARH